MRAVERSFERSQEFLIADKLTSRFVPYLDYFCRNPVKLHYWKSINLAVTDMDLPPSLLAPFKRELGDDVHSLKYVILQLNQNGKKAEDTLELDETLEMINLAKRYNLNSIEFNAICRSFVAPNGSPTQPAPKNSKASPKQIPPPQATQLPQPRPGLVLYRRDSRRKGSCSVLNTDGTTVTVKWHHNGKITKVSIHNLRSPRLYSTTRLF